MRLAALRADGSVKRWNVVAPSGEVLGHSITGGGVSQYYLKDRLGSVRAMVDKVGRADTKGYYPFGLHLPGRTTSGGGAAREDFTGHERDPATGLVYAGARYLMPALGRWTTTDPILGEKGPKALLKQDARLLGASPYNYTFNNPTNLTDPTGKCPWCAAGAAAWAVAELAMSAYDAYDAYTTATDPNASSLGKTASVGGAAAGILLPGGGYSAADNAVKVAGKTLSRLNIDKAAVNVVEGSSGKAAAVIGQGTKRVEGLASKVGGKTFSPSKEALKKWDKLLEQAGGKRLSDKAVKQTKLFKENKQWIEKMKNQGRTVIDIGSQSGRGKSTFYEMEKGIIYD